MTLCSKGYSVQNLAFELPAGLLVPGDNEVSISAPGGTDAPFDIVDVLILFELELSALRLEAQ